MLASGTAKYGRPKARMPRLSMVSSSGVRARSTMLPRPTEVRAPSASSSCCSRSGSSDKVMTSAASGTSTTSTASGACGARGRTIPTYSRAAQVKMIATKRKNQAPLSSRMPAAMIGVPTAAVSRRCVEEAGAVRGGWLTCSMAGPGASYHRRRPGRCCRAVDCRHFSCRQFVRGTNAVRRLALEAYSKRLSGRPPHPLDPLPTPPGGKGTPPPPLRWGCLLACRQDLEDDAGGIGIAQGEAVGMGFGPAALEGEVELGVAAEQQPADVRGGEVVEPGRLRGIDPRVAGGIAGGDGQIGAVDVDVDRLPLEERAHGRIDEVGARRPDDVDGAVAAVRVEPPPGAGEQVGRGGVRGPLAGQGARAVAGPEARQQRRAEQGQGEGGGGGGAGMPPQRAAQAGRDPEADGRQ